MSIKAQEQIDGCFAHAALDEPVFVLRAQDVLAGPIVREWANRYQQKHLARGTQGRPLAKAILKYEEALELADQMDSWHTKKLPD